MEGWIEFSTSDGDYYEHDMVGDDQAEIRAELESTLDSMLEDDGVDFEYVESIRTGENSFMVLVYADDGETMGNGSIEIEG